MNTEAFDQLERALRTYRDSLAGSTRKFDMTHWFRDARSNPGLGCGTAACALGVACGDRWFQDLGLQLVFMPYPDFLDGVPGFWEPVFRRFGSRTLYQGIAAAAQLFDISRADANELFHRCFYAGCESREVSVDDVLAAITRLRVHGYVHDAAVRADGEADPDVDDDPGLEP